jgi:hypothetical protein
MAAQQLVLRRSKDPPDDPLTVRYGPAHCGMGEPAQREQPPHNSARQRSRQLSAGRAVASSPSIGSGVVISPKSSSSWGGSQTNARHG